MQMWLRGKGYPVWGTGNAEHLEYDRYDFKRLLQAVGQPVGPFQRFIGMDSLKEALEKSENDGSFLKTGGEARGDFETRKHVNWSLTEPWFRRTDLKFGPYRDEIEVLMESPIEGIEFGYDGYCVDGQFPQQAMWGWEGKDKLYGMKCTGYRALPSDVRESIESVAPMLSEMGCRGNFHTEGRLADDGTYYFTDLTARCGAPPHELMSRLIRNWGEIVHHGARGQLVEPDCQTTYGFMLVLKSDPALTNFVGIKVPREYEDLVALQHAARFGEIYQHVPEDGIDRIGAALGFSNESWEKAAEQALEVADAVEAEDLDYDHEPIETFGKMLDKAKKYGLGEF